MLLTVRQQDILSLLEGFKCLRSSHIKRYMAAKHNSTDEQLSKMLKQLIFMGRIKTDGGFVMLPGRKINPGVIRAFDVAMDLTDGNMDLVYPGREPFTLMFSVMANADGAGHNNFGVAIAKPCFENVLCGRLNSADRNLTVIFVLEDPEQQKLLKVENRHYYAIQDETGKYKFYRAVEKPRNKREG